MKADVIDITGKITEKIELPQEVFGAEINEQLIAQAILVYLANQRQGTHDTKTRAEVRGGGRKPWKQKGTGRARQGSTRAPHWKGGGIVFGPEPRDHSLALPVKMRRQALYGALSDKFKNKKIIFVTGLADIKNKTKELAKVLEIITDKTKKKLIIMPEKIESLWRAGRNIKNLNLIPARQLNPYIVMNSNLLIIMKEAINKIKIKKGENAAT